MTIFIWSHSSGATHTVTTKKMKNTNTIDQKFSQPDNLQQSSRPEWYIGTNLQLLPHNLPLRQNKSLFNKLNLVLMARIHGHCTSAGGRSSGRWRYNCRGTSIKKWRGKGCSAHTGLKGDDRGSAIYTHPPFKRHCKVCLKRISPVQWHSFNSVSEIANLSHKIAPKMFFRKKNAMCIHWMYQTSLVHVYTYYIQ